MAVSTLGDARVSQESPATPPGPPYSPVTPVISQFDDSVPATESLATSPLPSTAPTDACSSESIPASSHTACSIASPLPPQFMKEPAPVPVSQSENPDAIALRSAITILQIQKQQALKDIQALDKMKSAALEDPHTFANKFLTGSLSPQQDELLHIHPLERRGSENGDNDDMDAKGIDQGQRSRSLGSSSNITQRLDKIPKPQNIVRMPAINWAKYHILGEPLDKMHEEQRLRPTTGEPRRDTSPSAPMSRSPEHVIAAPYRPFVDKINPRVKARVGSK